MEAASSEKKDAVSSIYIRPFRHGGEYGSRSRSNSRGASSKHLQLPGEQVYLHYTFLPHPFRWSCGTQRRLGLLPVQGVPDLRSQLLVVRENLEFSAWRDSDIILDEKGCPSLTISTSMADRFVMADIFPEGPEFYLVTDGKRWSSVMTEIRHHLCFGLS